MTEFSKLVEQMRVNGIKHDIEDATKDFKGKGVPQFALRRVAKGLQIEYNEVKKFYYELIKEKRSDSI